MNYEEMIAAASAYADRSDIEVTGSMDTFIVMAEGRINRLLKVRKQSARAFTPTVEDQEYYSLPPDYSGMRSVTLNSDLPDASHSVTRFDYIAPYVMDDVTNRQDLCRNYHTIIGNQLRIFPRQKAGKSIEMAYYQKVPNLNSEFPSNWLSEDYPDIYLSGILAEIELFVKNYSSATLWYDRMTTSLQELESTDKMERWTGSPLTTVSLGNV